MDRLPQCDINLSELSEHELTILKLLLEHHEGVTIGWLLSVIYGKQTITDKHYYERSRKRLYRLLNKLVSKGFVIKERMGRRIIYKITYPCAVALIDLIIKRRNCVSQTCPRKQTLDDFIRSKSMEEIDDMDISFSRKVKFKALKIVLETNNLTNDEKGELIGLFEQYLEDIDEKRLLFIDEDGEFQVKPYETRFNSDRMERKYKRFYRNIWKKAAKKYRWGVHATFTIDPKKFEGKNLKDIVKAAQKEFNRFMTWLKKKKGRKIEYVRFIEYQENGRVHYHVVFFGIRSIGNQELIGREYWRLGFVKARQIVNKRGKWVFTKKPDDYDDRYRRYRRLKTGKETDGGKIMSKDVSVYFYFNAGGNLMKDDGKAFDSLDDYDKLQFALHWALGTRFFTYSSFFRSDGEIRIPSGWIFIGSVYEFELDYYLPYGGVHIVYPVSSFRVMKAEGMG